MPTQQCRPFLVTSEHCRTTYYCVVVAMANGFFVWVCVTWRGPPNARLNPAIDCQGRNCLVLAESDAGCCNPHALMVQCCDLLRHLEGP